MYMARNCFTEVREHVRTDRLTLKFRANIHPGTLHFRMPSWNVVEVERVMWRLPLCMYVIVAATIDGIAH